MALVKAIDYAKTDKARAAESTALGKPAISTALNASQSTNTPQNYRDMDWRDQLKLFQTDRTTGQSELQRAMNQANLYKATGDNDDLNRANTWIGQINTAMGGSADPNKSKSTMYNNLYEGLITKPPEQLTAPKPFEYTQANIQSDPIYQNAIAQALQGAQQATGNAMVGLGARGIGNSSIAVDRANQIQQRAVGDVNSNLLPTLIEQAYNRYLNQNETDFKINQENYNRNNEYAGNLSSLATAYNDRYNQGIEQEEKRKAANIKNAMDLSEQYGFGVLPKDSGEELFKQVEGAPTLKASEAQTKYLTDLVTNSDKLGYVLPELAQLIGVDPYSNTLSAQKEINDFAYRSGMLGVSRQNANTAAASQRTSADRLAFDRDKEANEGAKASDYYKELDSSIFIQPEVSIDEWGDTVKTGKTVVADPEGMMQYIESLGLDDVEKIKLYRRYKLDTSGIGTGVQDEVLSDEDISQYLNQG